MSAAHSSSTDAMLQAAASGLRLSQDAAGSAGVPSSSCVTAGGSGSGSGSGAGLGGGATSTSARQPPWHVPVPAKGDEAPTLRLYNSLTRSKVPFVPLRSNHVVWYNCGPTVYDASHMGHARNYVSQDVVRRVLRDHFGYSVHLVMNITDVDDKIILKARHEHLLAELRTRQPRLTKELLATTRQAWSAFFRKNLKRFAPKPPPDEPQEPEDEAAWEEISRRWQGDEAWRLKVREEQPKAEMWFKALDASRQAQVAATMALASPSPPEDASLAAQLIDASVDVLAPYLDAQSGHLVTDPSIFRRTAAHWERCFFDDMARLHVQRPTTLTRVSEYVPEIVAFVQRIVDNGFAYVDESPGEGKANVWFDTRKFDGAEIPDRGTHEARGVNGTGDEVARAKPREDHFSYAKLAPWSKGNKDLIEEGEGSLSTGTSTTRGKRHPSDFALWKSSKPGEPAWPSPWGAGRPGWHIECSVMAAEVLGERLDIHSGGQDLMFPHHDNEVAQSEAHNLSAPWVNYFLHTGHLHIEGLKMSKSLKNFITVQEALERFSARQLRLAFLMQSWWARMDFKEAAVSEVKNVEATFNNFFGAVKALRRDARAKGVSTDSDGEHHYGVAEKSLMATLSRVQVDFHAAMCDSIDTPRGVDCLLHLVSQANVYERTASAARRSVNLGVLEAVSQWVASKLRMLGLGEGALREDDVGWGDLEDEADAALGGAGGASREQVVLPYVQALASFRDSVRQLARQGAPASELLALADRLRDAELVELGVSLEDQADGRALVKLAPRAQLLEARAERERAAAEKAARKAESARLAAEARRLRLERGRTPPQQLFRPPHVGEAEYSAWDERGIPTLDGEGNEVAKKRRKNCEKEWQRQEALHREYLEAKEKGDVE